MDKQVKLYRDVIEYFGGISPTARVIGVSKSTVAGWVGYGQKKKVLSCMSPLIAFYCQIESDGHFRAADLSPELKSILSLCSENLEPDDIFKISKLRKWAREYGYKNG